jgi:hypothetical protein
MDRAACVRIASLSGTLADDWRRLHVETVRAFRRVYRQQLPGIPILLGASVTLE